MYGSEALINFTMLNYHHYIFPKLFHHLIQKFYTHLAITLQFIFSLNLPIKDISFKWNYSNLSFYPAYLTQQAEMAHLMAHSMAHPCCSSISKFHFLWRNNNPLISHASKVMLKTVQARLQQYVNCELPDFKLVLEKAEEPEIKLPTSSGSQKKQESSRKTSISALLTMPKPLTVWITINCEKF